MHRYHKIWIWQTIALKKRITNIVVITLYNPMGYKAFHTIFSREAIFLKNAWSKTIMKKMHVMEPKAMLL